MREPTYFMLTALLAGPLHGYGIITAVKQLSGGRVALAAGTLYAALDRLTAEGLVEAVREETVNGRARRYYGLTPDGAAALREQASHLAEMARLVTDAPAPAVRAGAAGTTAVRIAHGLQGRAGA